MLKILTLNIGFYGNKHGAWATRKDAIRDVIEEHRPDIIAFQAVAQNPEFDGRSQVEQLATKMSEYTDFVFYPAATFDNNQMEGMAFLSKQPVADTNAYELSQRAGTDDTFKRIVLHARYNVAGQPFNIFNCHFSWVGEQFEDNVNDALPRVTSFNEPGLIIGDFNQTPDNPNWQKFRDAGYSDVWAAHRPEENGFTFESDNPMIRIDYIWAKNDLIESVQAIEIAQKEKDGIRLSDHLGLVVTLDL